MSETNPNDFAGHVPEDVGASGPESGKIYSHILLLANGERVYWQADDMDPHAAPPTEIDGVAVLSVSHATVGGPA